MASFREGAAPGENAALLAACRDVAARVGGVLTVKARCGDGGGATCDMASLLEHPEPGAGFLDACLRVADAMSESACSAP